MGGTKDFTLQRLVAHGTTSDDVWHGTGPTRKDVAGTNTNYGVGSIRCFTGKSSYTECGAIEDNSWSGNVNVPNVGVVFFSDLVKHEANSKGGDSGAPFYRIVNNTSVYAAGILSAGDAISTYHAKWTRVPSNWDVTIELNN